MPAAEANPLMLTTMAWRAWAGLEAAEAAGAHTDTTANNSNAISSLRLNVMLKCRPVGAAAAISGTLPEPAQALEASLGRQEESTHKK